MKKTLITALSVISCALWADPAPVADLSRSGSITVKPKYNSTSERIEALERVVEARANAQLQMQQQLSALLDEVAELRGVTETHAYRLDEILQQQRNIYQEMDRRLGNPHPASSSVAPNTPPTSTEKLSQAPVGNPAAAMGTQVESIDEFQVASSVNRSEEGSYESAVNLVLKERNYDAAIPAFEAFVREYPNSSYAANSYYWLGQLYFTKNETLKAKAHFERVVSQFSTSSKAPDALAKLAQLAEKSGDMVAAKQFYQLLVKNYPQSKVAKTAQAKLESL